MSLLISRCMPNCLQSLRPAHAENWTWELHPGFHVSWSNLSISVSTYCCSGCLSNNLDQKQLSQRLMGLFDMTYTCPNREETSYTEMPTPCCLSRFISINPFPGIFASSVPRSLVFTNIILTLRVFVHHISPSTLLTSRKKIMFL